MWKYCENIVIKIDTDFNFNILLKLFFSLSKKIIFFSPILANNNLPLKIYCEKIVIIFHSSFFLFSPSFFILHTWHFFIFFFPLFFSSTHVPLLFSFLSLFSPFFSKPFLQTPEHSELSFFVSFFFSFLPFLLALRLLVLGRINSVPLRFWQRRIHRSAWRRWGGGVRDGEWLRGKGLEIENEVGVGVGGFDWEGFTNLIKPRARCCCRWFVL